MTISKEEMALREQARGAVLNLILKSADKVNPTAGENVRALAEAYALVVGQKAS